MLHIVDHYSESEKESIDDQNEILEKLLAGASFKEILNVNEANMHDWINDANNFIAEGKYDDASDLISVLTALDPYNKNLWKISYELAIKQKNYDSALVSVSFAMSIDSTDIYLNIYAFKILTKKQDYSGAKQEQDYIEEVLRESPEEIVNTLRDVYGHTIEDARMAFETALHG